MQVALDAPTRPALRYYGGKHSLAAWIIGFFPEHLNYVEPCGGAASVLLQKPRSALETYNDIDGNVVNFFCVLRDRRDELMHQIRLTPWARSEFETCRNADIKPLENARRFFVSSWMGISNMPFDQHTGWRTATYREQCYTTHVENYFDLVEDGALEKIAKRFLGVQIENRSYEYVLTRYDHETSLIYFDPPYVSNTRTVPNVYTLEWTDDDHKKAASLLYECQGYVIISGYACPLYTDLYERHGWQRHDKVAQTNSGGKRTESVWLNPRTVEALARPQQQGLFG